LPVAVDSTYGIPPAAMPVVVKETSSTLSAFRFATFVVDVTVSGAVPIPTVEVND